MLISSWNNRPHPLSDPYEYPIEHLILVCDVDGVLRYSTDEEIDFRVVEALQMLTNNCHADVALISGTPIVHDASLEEWRRSNLTLDKAVGKFLEHQIQNHTVTLYGALGGQLMTAESDVKIIDQYPIETSFALARLLLFAFLEEVKTHFNERNIEISNDLKKQLDRLNLLHPNQNPYATPIEFGAIVEAIRSSLDPNFRLVTYGAFIESHTSNPPWTTTNAFAWLNAELQRSLPCLSKLHENEKKVTTGLAYRGKEGFNFLMISKTNKGRTIKKYIDEKLKKHPSACVITIGDTQVDFPMHQYADFAYHVGLEQIWKDHPLPQCYLVKNLSGCDKQHVEGTLYILKKITQICSSKNRSLASVKGLN